MVDRSAAVEKSWKTHPGPRGTAGGPVIQESCKRPLLAGAPVIVTSIVMALRALKESKFFMYFASWGQF